MKKNKLLKIIFALTILMQFSVQPFMAIGSSAEDTNETAKRLAEETTQNLEQTEETIEYKENTEDNRTENSVIGDESSFTSEKQLK